MHMNIYIYIYIYTHLFKAHKQVFCAHPGDILICLWNGRGCVETELARRIQVMRKDSRYDFVWERM